MEDQIRLGPMHVTEEASSGVASASVSSSSSSNTKGNFKIRLPTVDIQDCCDQRHGLSEDDLEDEFAISKTASAIKSSPTPALTPPQCTPRSTSPLLRSPVRKLSSASTNNSVAASNSPSSSSTTNNASNQKQFLQG